MKSFEERLILGRLVVNLWWAKVRFLRFAYPDINDVWNGNSAIELLILKF
jgi:hypothetical protein